MHDGAGGGQSLDHGDADIIGDGILREWRMCLGMAVVDTSRATAALGRSFPIVPVPLSLIASLVIVGRSKISRKFPQGCFRKGKGSLSRMNQKRFGTQTWRFLIFDQSTRHSESHESTARNLRREELEPAKSCIAPLCLETRRQRRRT